MDDFQINFLHWWIFAVVAFFIELLIGTEIITWLAVGASFVGAVLIFMPTIPFSYQILIFCILSILSALFGEFVIKKFSKETDHPNLNAYGQEYVGCCFELREPIVNGIGSVQDHNDNIWRVEGPDCPVGTRVRVTSIVRARFQVEIEDDE